MNVNLDKQGKEAEKPPLPEGREDLLTLVREVCGAIPATVLEISDDKQILAFVQSLQRSDLLPEPLEEEGDENGARKSGARLGDAKPAEAKSPPVKELDVAKPSADESKAAEDGGERRGQMLSYVAKSLQEAAKLLRDAPQDQVELFAKRLQMIVTDLKVNLDKPN